MIRKSIVTCLCLGGLVIGAAAIAQPSKDKPASPAAPAAPAGMPGPEEMAKMMEAWQKSMTPGKMHEHLQKSVGKWDGKIKSWMAGPDAPPSESKGTTEITGMMGGRFTRGETKATFDLGDGQATPFEGFGIYGFNNTTEQFECTWCDSFGTMMMHFTGKLSEDGKVLTWNSKFVDPMSGKESWMRMTETWNGPDAMTLSMFQPGFDGKEMKMMEIAYTRVGGKPKTETKPAMTK